MTSIMAEELVHGFERQLSSVSNRLWLPFEREILQKLLTEDALVVMAKGLGLGRLFATIARVFCSPRVLVLCLLAHDHAPVLLQQVMDLGLNETANGQFQLPKVIDNKSNVTEREQLYKKGGCLFITSRILVVDMLNNRIDRKMISGLLVYDAHRVTDTSIEAFIIRLYREENRTGFLKAFSQEPLALGSGFHKLEHTLKLLFLRQVLLYPRFHVDIHHCLSQHQPQVYEIEVALTPRMNAMQQAILVALDATLKELQKTTKCLDATELTMEKALTKSFASVVRSQLDPVWHQIPFKTKQLVGDLTTLRQLLSYLTHYDAISYYSFLLNHQTVSGQQRHPSPWLFSEAADRLLQNAKARLYMVQKTTNTLQLVLESNPKWEVLAQILEEIEQEEQAQGGAEKLVDCRAFAGGSHVLVLVKDDRTAVQLREFLALGGQRMLRKRFGHYLKQKVALWSKRTDSGASASASATHKSKLSAEQKLLMEFSKTFDGLAPNDPPPSPAAQAQMDANVGKAKATRKRRRASDNADPTDLLLVADTLAKDSATYGMSIDELEAFRVQALGGRKSQQRENTTTNQRVFELLKPARTLSICTFAQAWDHNLLELLMPQKVVLYDANVAFVRELEHFHARHASLSLHKPGSRGQAMEIYFLNYEESAEQQLYLHEISTEKKTFEVLIRQQNTLMLPLNVYDLPISAKIRHNLGSQYSMDTRTGGRALKHNHQGIKIIVDVREFRGALPSMLHREGLVLSPVTLEIGDFILSPLICVERKSISDLYGSFASGRLFHQAQQMGRFYQIPVLLIEFTEGKTFSLQDASEISNDISPANIISKLVLLILHFPLLRVLWSRSPHATVEIFKALKKGQEEPNVEVAMALGNPNAPNGSSGPNEPLSEGPEPTKTTTESETNDMDKHNTISNRTMMTTTTTTTIPIEDQFYNMSSMDVLKKLPGVNEHNYRKVLTKVNNLAELSRLRQTEMIQLLGKSCGKKLFEFFNSSL